MAVKVGKVGSAPPVVGAAGAAAPNKKELDKATQAAKRGIEAGNGVGQSSAGELIELLSEPLEQRAAPDSPQSSNKVDLVKKVADFNLGGSKEPTSDLQRMRVVSTGGFCTHRIEDGLRYITFDEESDLELFKSGLTWICMPSLFQASTSKAEL